MATHAVNKIVTFFQMLGEVAVLLDNILVMAALKSVGGLNKRCGFCLELSTNMRPTGGDLSQENKCHQCPNELL
jgi:hypothetical protein